MRGICIPLVLGVGHGYTDMRLLLPHRNCALELPQCEASRGVPHQQEVGWGRIEWYCRRLEHGCLHVQACQQVSTQSVGYPSKPVSCGKRLSHTMVGRQHTHNFTAKWQAPHHEAGTRARFKHHEAHGSGRLNIRIVTISDSATSSAHLDGQCGSGGRHIAQERRVITGLQGHHGTHPPPVRPCFEHTLSLITAFDVHEEVLTAS